MIKYKISLSIILWPLFFIYPQSDYVPGSVYYGRNNYIEYTAGNLPIIFSAPHGGNLIPSEIPDRTYGAIVNDTNIKELAEQLFHELYSITGKYPHMILCNLKRIKLDANRDSAEAAQGNPAALQAWQEYHNFIRSASNIVTTSYKRGLYLDLHGHGHTIPRLEIGYLLSGSDLDKSDAELNSGTFKSKTSIKNLVISNSNSYSFAEILRGDKSLGTLFQSLNIPAVPSSTMLSPLGADYFSGGYSTEIHGSRYGGTIDAIQIEHHYNGIRNNSQNIAAYVKKFAQTILQYLENFYNFDFVSVVAEGATLPDEFFLSQNYPNPFNPTTSISYTLPVESRVRLSIFNVLGEKLVTLVDEIKSSGNYKVNWDANNISSGIYLYKIEAIPQNGEKPFTQVKKMILLK